MEVYLEHNPLGDFSLHLLPKALKKISVEFEKYTFEVVSSNYIKTRVEHLLYKWELVDEKRSTQYGDTISVHRYNAISYPTPVVPDVINVYKNIVMQVLNINKEA